MASTKGSARQPDARQAGDLIAGAGERPTAARVAVLAVLLAAERALTHAEIGARARQGRGRLDRVTVYRALERLVERGLVHRIAGDDRVWRFNAAGRPVHAHPHFECTRCGRVYCLEEVEAAPSVDVPRGFRPERVELTVKGACDACRTG